MLAISGVLEHESAALSSHHYSWPVFYLGINGGGQLCGPTAHLVFGVDPISKVSSPPRVNSWCPRYIRSSAVPLRAAFWM
jgi:hypothetical protein